MNFKNKKFLGLLITLTGFIIAISAANFLRVNLNSIFEQLIFVIVLVMILFYIGGGALIALSADVAEGQEKTQNIIKEFDNKIKVFSNDELSNELYIACKDKDYPEWKFTRLNYQAAFRWVQIQVERKV